MELKNFDQMLEMIPKSDGPKRVVLAGSDGENTLKGIFAAQEAGFAQPVLVGDRARTIAELEKLGLEELKEAYTAYTFFINNNFRKSDFNNFALSFQLRNKSIL